MAQRPPAAIDHPEVAPMPVVAPASAASRPNRRAAWRRPRFGPLTRTDRIVLALFVGLPLLLQAALVWLPAIASVALSFTSWDGIGGLGEAEFVGTRNYQTLVEAYPPFWSAIRNNLVWLAVFVFVATPLGILFAVLLDREIRGSRFYRSALYLPVVLSLALVGFIWQLQYAPEQGFLNNLLGTTGAAGAGGPGGPLIDWLGNRDLNLWAVLVAASWRHVGYVMILYLAGLKAMDPTLREAAAIDGASERQAFLRVTFPVLRPINVVIVVVTAIEALRAFDLVFVINRGMNGLELLSILVTNNIVGEASRIGFGSAIATVLLVVSIVPILVFLRLATREGAR